MLTNSGTFRKEQNMITLIQAKSLNYGDVLHHTSHTNADGTPQRWRVIGHPKTWKRTPSKVKVPIKHGLRSFDYITEDSLELVSIAGGNV